MKESFLCYESGDSLFLIMLDAVLHILEAPADGQECVKFQGHEIPVQDFCRRFGGCPREESRYAVLLKAGDRLGGIPGGTDSGSLRAGGRELQGPAPGSARPGQRLFAGGGLGGNGGKLWISGGQ